MDVLIVLVFVSLVFVAGAILLFLVSLHQRDFEHAERLALLPILDAEPATTAGLATPAANAPGTWCDRDSAPAASEPHRP